MRPPPPGTPLLERCELISKWLETNPTLVGREDQLHHLVAGIREAALLLRNGVGNMGAAFSGGALLGKWEGAATTSPAEDKPPASPARRKR